MAKQIIHGLIMLALGSLAQAADAPPAPQNPGLPLTWQEKGMQALTNLTRQLQCKLSEEQPATLKSLPPGLEAPRFGIISIGPDTDRQLFHVCLDQPKGALRRLWIDEKASGELALVTDWRRVGKTDAAEGSFTLQAVVCGTVRPARFTCQIADSKDNGMVWARNLLLYEADCGWRGDIKLGAKAFAGCIMDLGGQLAFHHAVPKLGVTLQVDLNGDKLFDRKLETFDLGAPFTTGGAPWRFASVSAEGIPVIEPISLVRQAIAVDQPCPILSFTTMTGRTLQFPRDFAGKIVYLDFWAMWCEYCVDAFPDLIACHKELNEKGLEIIGVNLDGPGRGEAIKKACERAGITWEHVYNGAGWDEALAGRFDVDKIPYGVLLDGTSGKVLALDLAADELRDAVRQVLSKR